MGTENNESNADFSSRDEEQASSNTQGSSGSTDSAGIEPEKGAQNAATKNNKGPFGPSLQDFISKRSKAYFDKKRKELEEEEKDKNPIRAQLARLKKDMYTMIEKLLIPMLKWLLNGGLGRAWQSLKNGASKLKESLLGPAKQNTQQLEDANSANNQQQLEEDSLNQSEQDNEARDSTQNTQQAEHRFSEQKDVRLSAQDDLQEPDDFTPDFSGIQMSSLSNTSASKASTLASEIDSANDEEERYDNHDNLDEDSIIQFGTVSN